MSTVNLKKPQLYVTRFYLCGYNAIMGRKKKQTGGKHKTPRLPVQIPVAWINVARNIAARRKMHTVWLLIDLVAAEAESMGVDTLGIETLPPFPWTSPPPE